jgi:hypothetical protein
LLFFSSLHGGSSLVSSFLLISELSSSVTLLFLLYMLPYARIWHVTSG